MMVEKVPLSQILPHPDNPRIPLSKKDPVFRQIQKSYKAFGRLLPYIVNKRNNYCLSGNQRMAVDMAEGVTEAYVVFVDLDERAEKKLMIALNRITGFWDNKKLATLLEEFTDVPNFDFESIGFSVPEVSQIFDRYLDVNDEDDFDFEKEAGGIVTPVTQKGDLIVLGKHRLLCSDSSDPKNIELLMDGLVANMLLTDPVYCIDYINTVRPKACRKWEKLYKDDLSQPEYEKWLRQILSNIEPHLMPGAPCYIFNGFRQFSQMIASLEGLNFQISCVIVWVKETFTMSFGNYHQGCEFAIYGWKRNKQGGHPWYGGADQSTVWQIARGATSKYEHPTQKPVELFARAIRNSSKRDDIIVDLFAGSGTAILASESLDRRCYSMEIEPAYCDVIARRYIAYKGINNVSEELRKKYRPEVANG